MSNETSPHDIINNFVQEQLRIQLRRQRAKRARLQNRLQQRGWKKITPELVKAIRDDRAKLHLTYPELADKYDVTSLTAGRICRGTLGGQFT